MRSRTSEPGSMAQNRARSKSGPSGGTETLKRVTLTVPLRRPIAYLLYCGRWDLSSGRRTRARLLGILLRGSGSGGRRRLLLLGIDCLGRLGLGRPILLLFGLLALDLAFLALDQDDLLLHRCRLFVVLDRLVLFFVDGHDLLDRLEVGVGLLLHLLLVEGLLLLERIDLVGIGGQRVGEVGGLVEVAQDRGGVGRQGAEVQGPDLGSLL